MGRKLLALIFAIVAIGIGIFALVTHFRNQAAQTAETTATIVRIESDVETDPDGEDIKMYYPVVKYTVEEQDYENRLSDSGNSDSTKYKEGDKITISYNPDSPDEFSRKGSKAGLMAGIIFIFMGVILLISAIRNN